MPDWGTTKLGRRRCERPSCPVSTVCQSGPSLSRRPAAEVCHRPGGRGHLGVQFYDPSPLTVRRISSR